MRFFLIALVALLAGCGKGGDDKHEEHHNIVPVPVTTYTTTTRSLVGYYDAVPVLRAALRKTDAIRSGDLISSSTEMWVTNISPDPMTVNFYVGGRGWEFQGSIVDLAPNASVFIGPVTAFPYAFDSETAFYIYVPTGNA